MDSSRWVCGPSPSTSDRSPSWIGSNPFCEAATSSRPVGRVDEGTSELVVGRDPDNQPLVFVCYTRDETLGPDYYRAIANLVFSLDA